MAVRIPVKEVEFSNAIGTAHSIRRCTQEEVNRITYQMLHSWAQQPSASIDVVSSGNMGTISDTRLEVGAAGSDATNFDTESETANVSTETVSYNKLSGSFNGTNPITITRGSDPGGPFSNASVTAISALSSGQNPALGDGKTSFPLYMTESGNDGAALGSSTSITLQEFSLQDMIDTFWVPAVDKLITASDSTTNNAGTFMVASGSGSAGFTLSDRSKVSTTPIFTDTRATASDYSAAGIPEAADQQDVVNYYHLYRWNHISSSSTLNTVAGAHLPHLLVHTRGSDVVQGGTTVQLERIRHTDLKAQLQAVARYACLNESGQRIQYALSTSDAGYNVRDTIIDTKLNSSTYLTNQVGDDYRSQEVPSGSAATINTYKFLIRKA